MSTTKNAVGKGLKAVFHGSQESTKEELAPESIKTEQADTNTSKPEDTEQSKLEQNVSEGLQSMLKDLPPIQSVGRPSAFREEYRHVPLVKVNYDIPETLRHRMKMYAAQENISMNNICVDAIKEYLDKYAPEKGKE